MGVARCSFITHKLRFFTYFRLISAASKTFFNGLLIPRCLCRGTITEQMIRPTKHAQR